MSITEHWALAALCLSAAVASGTAVVMLSSADAKPRHDEIRSAPLIRSIPVQTASIPAPRLRPANDLHATPSDAPALEDRFGFVPLHATDTLFAALAEDELSSGMPDPWTTETTAAPRSIVRLPNESDALPWQAPQFPRKSYTLSERLREIGPSARDRLQQKFIAAKAPWRPTELTLVAIKDEKVLELHARPAGGNWTFIHRYPVLAASGVTGPKLRRGDKQVPEGIYGISFLNANSRFHVALRVNYPNAFDRKMGVRDGRKDLGGDIMIHGKAASVGCLAVGDAAAEELFVLAADTGLKNIKLVVAPTDFRKNAAPSAETGQPVWLPQLYADLTAAMAPYKSPSTEGLLSFFSK